MLVPKVTAPVAALMVKAAGAAVNVPPAVAVCVTFAEPAFEEYGVPL